MNQRIQRDLTVAFTVLVIVVGALVAHSLLTSGAATKRGLSLQAQAQLQTAVNAPRNVVPFLGPFRKGQCGPAIRNMEGALRHTTPPVRKEPASSCIGAATVRQLKVFQLRHKIPATGIYGSRTHAALEHAYTSAERAALIYTAQVRLNTKRRAAILTVTAHARAVQGLMGYCNHGSLSDCGLRWQWPAYPDVPRHTDCSGYVTWVYYQAGLPDPNGASYRGGYTGTLVVHGVAVRPGAPLHVGDLVLYGPSVSNTTHVAIYIGHGLVSSHGQPGIDIYQYNYRTPVAIRRYF